MNNLRKAVRLLLVFVLLLGVLSGCGGSGGKPAVEESNEPVLKETVEEVSEESAPEETVAAPTPAVFFGVEANPVIAQWDEFVFEKDPAPAAAAYADLLQNAFGFTVTEQSTDDQVSRWSLQYGDRENAGINISSTFTQAEKYVVTVIYSQSIRWQDGAVYDWPVTDKAFLPNSTADRELNPPQMPVFPTEPVSETEPEPVVSGPVLPDPAAFLGGISPTEDEPADHSGWHVYYRTQIDEGWTAAHEYVELLSDSRYGFT